MERQKYPDGKRPPLNETSGTNTQQEYDEHSEGFKEVTLSRPPPTSHSHLSVPTALEWSNMTQSETRYRRLFEAARDGILLLDVDTGCITDANPFLYELLGYSPGELLGKELWEIGLFEDRAANQAAFEKLHRVGYIRYEDKPLETQEGQRREVEFVSNVYRENGHIVIQCNIRDITERKRIERALHAALAREQRITEVLQHPLTEDISEESFPGLLVGACYEPFMKEAQVGGDFFDAFAIHGEKEGACRIVLAVGDVTGKGLMAAVLAGRVKEVMRAFLHEDTDPARTLDRLNDYLCDPVSNRGCAVDGLRRELALITLSLVVFDPQTGNALFSCAGAEPPAIFRTNGVVEEIEARGQLLGVAAGASYTVTQVTLHPGDTLLMTTDGLTETRRSPRPGAVGARPELLGYEGMLGIARKHLELSPVRAMSHAIVKEARSFGEGFRDDVCLLMARRR